MNYHNFRNSMNHRKQKGAITMISAILILILLTEMIIYAVHTGVFEQRKSSNELRQKIAFHVADSGIQQAKEFLVKNAVFMASNEADLIPIVDGKGDITGYKPGWLSAGAGRWNQCAGNYESDTTHEHPCWGEPVPALRDNSYFYVSGGSNLLVTDPVMAAGPNETVSMNALLCMLHVDENLDPVVQGCTYNQDLQDDRYFLVTLLARGQADCDDNGLNCTAEALIAEKIGSFSPTSGEGGPGAPLTTKSSLPESGDTDIVANPNGGGVGVPVSVWIDGDQDILGFGGSWTTCEAHEWYETDILPDDYKCPAGSGNCTCDGKKQLSHASPGADEQFLNIDMVPDDSFPDPLFTYFFMKDANEAGLEELKQEAQEVYPDCSALGPDSWGLIVIEGNCNITGNLQIGTHKAPVFLVLAGSDYKVAGTVDIFGAVFFTDIINTSSLSGGGTVTLYGALIADGDISKFGGNLKLVYVEDILKRVFEIGNVGTVAGGWSDFHADWR